MKHILTLLFTALLLAPLLSLRAADVKPAKPPAESVPFNTIIGTQAIGGRYHFTQDAPLLESAQLIAELGSGIMKFSISPQASFGKTKANVKSPNHPTEHRLTTA